MTKSEKQQLETICRYLKDGFQDLNCGRIAIGMSNVEKAEVLLDALLAMEDAKQRKTN
ncbi:MAG: hypothetical protein E6X23_19945 [Mixta calida]|uniref:hypothetical protein n=1 Tax=Mixta TaxID=2100764 RepID=UPI001875A99A|nr:MULTISPECIES: hypothetical protein [Mixta]MBE5254525.1 hypothetical protein [Mixta mediterraneensis]MDU4288345.1 hypothetical protein [Mixta calida]MDU4943781.1 hypothetical protein [Mixta calida]MDU6413464.1 hypothetical protein [Mixta calida]